jgi:putative transcriptional regulator
MSTYPSLKNHFLIAMPTMADPNFSQTITYICEHNQDGAMGIVVNRPLVLTWSQLLEHLKVEPIPVDLADRNVLWGGPVQLERGFVLHRSRTAWDSTMEVQDGIFLTTSREIIDAIGRGDGPEDALIALGYAGWSAGQLEDEMANNAWLSVAANGHVLFDTPFEQRWHAAAQLLGVNLSLISTQAGHA